MAVPEQIRRQSEQIAALYADMERDKVDDAGTDDTVDDPQPITPVQPVVTTDHELEALRQRYAALEAASNTQISQLTSQLTEATKRLGQVELLLATQAEAPKSTPTPPASLLTDQEREEYGESIEIMRKVTQETAQPFLHKIAQLEAVIASLQPQTAHLTKTVENVVATNVRSATDRFYNDLTVLVPNWETINADKDFHAWLMSPDPLTGLTRQTLLEDAHKNLDATRTANFFTAWSGYKPPVQDSKIKDQRTKELEDQVAPTPGKNKPTGQTPQKKVYTTKDVAKFYSDVRSGKYKGKEAEKDRIENDIFLAQTEGRLTT